MRHFAVILACLIVLALPTFAANPQLAPRAPEKPLSNVVPPPADPNVVRQGGDTIIDAVAIPIPYSGTGTTTGYTDDYDEECPFDSLSPEVVYQLTPASDMTINIDLCGSSYDTKLYVYDESLDVVACNDDFYSGEPCGNWVSKIEYLPVTGGATYYLVIDGYGGASGDYLLEITEYVPCELDCPAGAVLEGEPPLENDYVDAWNGGCASDPPGIDMQAITSPLFCGVTGWFLIDGGNGRDTDWFLIDIPASGVLEIVGDAEFESYMFELGPQDCDDVVVVQSVIMGPCAEATITITGDPGSTVWFWVGSTTFWPPFGPDVQEYDYVLRLNLEPVATENHSWSEVKSLFD